MCDYCKPVLGSCVSAHNLEKCVLKRSLYCLKCHNYGHCINECNLHYEDIMILENLIPSNLIQQHSITSITPVIKSSSIGVYNSENPKYLEDLIPTYYIKKYMISSKTPFKFKEEKSSLKPVIDIIDHPKVIRDY